MVAKDSVGESGGLPIFWRKGIDLTIKSMSKYHINMVIKEEENFEWRLTRMYGKSKSEEKEKTWILSKLCMEPSRYPGCVHVKGLHTKLRRALAA